MRGLKTFKEFNESLDSISVEGITFKFNKNKSQEEWLKRIKDRTQYSEVTFKEVITKGIAKAFKENKLCIKGTTCLRFVKSNFVLVLNLKEKKIITIRDGSWDKTDNGKCSFGWIFEDYKNNTELEQFIQNIDCDTEGYFISLNYLNEDLEMTIKDKCDCCYELNL